jgi:hypothetical protein
MSKIKSFLTGVWKAIGGGFFSASAVAGITWSELNWGELLVAFFVGAVGVYLTPSNKTAEPDGE